VGLSPINLLTAKGLPDMIRLSTRLFAMLLLVCAGMGVARAQMAEVVTTCGLITLPVNSSTASWHFYMDATGNLCVTGGSGGGGGAVTNAGTFAVQSSPGARTIVTLDVATVTTGGTAVTALTAGHKTAGGWIQNPPSATINLCLAEIGTAAGATSAGNTVCITPGQSYGLTPSSGAVSVISSDNSHPFAGYGLQ
jgi:hypothetical protein